MGTSVASLNGRAAGRWDPVVRLTHWVIAFGVLANGFLTEEGGRAHVWIGYVVFSLLALRLVWGVVGAEDARFSAFPPSFRAALDHLRDLRLGRRVDHRSHNPLGALMVYALWGTLLVVAVTGISMAGSPFAPDTAMVSNERSIHAPRHVGGHEEAEREEEEESLIGEIHGAAANLLLILAAFHVAGVAVESRRSGRNLALEMVTGARSEAHR
jgi:cytochrome b